MENRRRKLNFSIKKQMQVRLLIKIMGIAIVGVALMAAVFYFYSNREINQSYRQFHIHADNFLELLLPAVVTSLVLALVGAVVITLFLPIKIAGPVYRIEKDLSDKVALGDLTYRIKLRKNDEFSELAESINTCLSNIGEKVSAAKKLADDIETRLASNDGGKDNKEIENLLGKLKDSLGQLKV